MNYESFVTPNNNDDDGIEKNDMIKQIPLNVRYLNSNFQFYYFPTI